MRGALAAVGVALAFGLAGPTVAVAQDPDLAGEWHLDSIAGGTTPDTSGHGDNGTVGGTPTAVADARFGQGVHFPAKTSYISALNTTTLQPRNVSVLAWVRSSSTPGNVEAIVAQGAQSGCSFASYALYTGGSADNTPSTRGVRFYVYAPGNAANTTPRTPPAPLSIWDGHWHAILGTFDGSAVRLYVDGQEVGAPVTLNTPGPIGYNLDLTKDFWIGNFAGGAQCIEQTQFAGDIDEVRVWDRALTDAEAAYVSSSTATTPPELPIPGPPPPPPANPPHNTTAPSISQLFTAGGPTGTYFCNNGTWTNLPSPPGYTYRWIATENGKPVTVGDGQTFSPTSAVWGYPIVCEVTVQGPTTPISASSNSVFFTSAGLNKLPPAYGDIRVKGIDVFQIVQPNAGALAFGYPSGTFTTYCGGGTPTAFVPIPRSFFCSPGANPQDAMQHTDYAGVKLDSDKSTTAAVYINTVNVPPSDPNLPISVELSGTSNGKSLGDPLVLPAPTPQASNFAVVMADERDTRSDQVQFHLPSSWTAQGNLTLTAHILFPKPDFGPTYGAFQCPSPTDPPGDAYQINQYPRPNCDTDDTFTLNDIPFEQFVGPIFQSVQLLTHAQTGFSQTPDQVMAAAKYLYPGGSRFSFGSYSSSSIDIDAASKVTVDSKGNCVDSAGNATGGTASGGQAIRVCRWYAIDALMGQWVASNPARTRSCRSILCNTYRRNYDGILAVSNYDSGGGIVGCSAGSFCPEPGVQHPVGNDVSKVSVSGPSAANTGWLIVNTTVHPVQGSSHELGHWLTLPHAGSATGPCKNAPLNETWPGDDSGRLQGVRFNATTGFRATPAVDGTPSARVIYDFMTYCGDFRDRRPTLAQTRRGTSPAAYPGNTWLSARNWQHVAAALDAMAVRLHLKLQQFPGGRLPLPAREASTAVAVGVAGPSSGVITRIVPTPGQTAVPSVAASPYRLRSLGAGGKVLLDAGIRIQPPGEIRTTSADGAFAGAVAPNASAVELVLGGRVLARKDRSRPPHVTLQLPRRGIHLRRGQRLSLRWRGSDPDSKSLQVTIAVSSDGGATWRSAFIGPNRGRVSLPATALAGSKRERVRVTLNDGFSAASATSATFKAPGSPPQAQIIAPVAGDTILAGQRTRLVATAVNDQNQTLTGRSLTWFAGRRRLGSGATLKVRLSAGKVTLRLVARGSVGISRTVTERLTVTAAKLRVTSLSVPQRVKKGANTVTITLRTSSTSKLVVGRKHYTVRTRSTRITLSLPAKPAVGLVKVPFTLSPRSRSVTGKIRGSVWVVRT